MALKLPQFNKPIQVDTYRRLFQPFIVVNGEFEIILNHKDGRVFYIDRSSGQLSVQIDPAASDLEGHFTAFDKVKIALWTYAPGRITRRKWSEINLPEPRANRFPVNLPRTFPPAVRAIAAYNDILLVMQSNFISLFRYDAGNHSLIDINRRITPSAIVEPPDEFDIVYIDVGTQHFSYYQQTDASELAYSSGVYRMTPDSDGIPTIEAVPINTQRIHAIANPGLRLDTAVYIDYPTAGSRATPAVYHERTIGSAQNPEGVFLRSQNIPIIRQSGGIAVRSMQLAAHLPEILNVNNFLGDTELLGDIVLTPIEYSLDADSVSRSDGNDNVSITHVQQVYSTSGAAKITFTLNKYEIHHLLISGWAFEYGGVRYQLDEITTETDDTLTAVFNATIQ